MSRSPQTPFDFDRWRYLAENDPPGFERRRREALERIIQSAPPAKRQRLRALQWRIDQVRRRSATPLGACVHLTRMMWQAVLGERGLLEALQGHGARPRRRARVLPFPDPCARTRPGP